LLNQKQLDVGSGINAAPEYEYYSWFNLFVSKIKILKNILKK